MQELPSLDPRELIASVIRLGELLSSQLPLEQRMEELCKEVVHALGCDRSSIMLWNGSEYAGTYNWGNPPDIADEFRQYRAPATYSIVRQAMETGTYVVINEARNHPSTKGISKAARIESLVVAPLFNDVGGPLGFMTAEFNAQLASFDDERAEMVMGAARLAQTALIAARERQRRRQSVWVQRQLLERLVSAEEGERRRISADIHDDSLQRMNALMHGIELAARATTDAATRETLETLADQSEQAAASLRHLIQDVHPPSVDLGGLHGALETLLGRLGDRYGWTTALVDTTTAEPPAAVISVLYRITQQALDNVARHAGATHVTVEVTEVDHATQISVTDDGRGFDPRAVPIDRFGLVSMADRAEFAGGSVDVSSSSGAGTTVTMRVPAAVNVPEVGR